MWKKPITMAKKKTAIEAPLITEEPKKSPKPEGWVSLRERDEIAKEIINILSKKVKSPKMCQAIANRIYRYYQDKEGDNSGTKENV